MKFNTRSKGPLIELKAATFLDVSESEAVAHNKCSSTSGLVQLQKQENLVRMQDVSFFNNTVLAHGIFEASYGSRVECLRCEFLENSSVLGGIAAAFAQGSVLI